MSFPRSSLGSHDRKLRYRALLDDLSNLDIEGANNDERMEKTSNAVREAQSLLAEGGVEERVRHPGEGYLDSRVVRATSDLAVRCSIAVSGNANNYDRHELAQHIRENPDMWEFPLPRELPVCAFLLGTFDPTPPEERPRVARRRAEKQQTAALATPENVHKLDKTEEGSEMVSRVNRFITKAYRNNGDRPLSYFHTVLDPTSFARSVENVYYVSFLARDQLISLHIDEDVGLPFIKPVPLSEREQDESGLADENQFIVSLDMQRWKDSEDIFHFAPNNNFNLNPRKRLREESVNFVKRTNSEEVKKIIKIEIFDGSMEPKAKICECKGEKCAQYIVKSIMMDDIYRKTLDIIAEISDSIKNC